MQPDKEQPDAPKDLYSHEFNLDAIPEIPLTGHQWIQMGNELKCTSCPFAHGTYIASDYQLYGIDEDGKPMIRKVTVTD